MEVEEFAWEPTLPPQLLRTIIQHSEEFEMLEVVEASAEMKGPRTDQAAMIGRIEVSLKMLLFCPLKIIVF